MEPWNHQPVTCADCDFENGHVEIGPPVKCSAHGKQFHRNYKEEINCELFRPKNSGRPPAMNPIEFWLKKDEEYRSNKVHAANKKDKEKEISLLKNTTVAAEHSAEAVTDAAKSLKHIEDALRRSNILTETGISFDAKKTMMELRSAKKTSRITFILAIISIILAAISILIKIIFNK
ncbi:MAG: hypothetical protein ACYS8W_05405 [Planctomycetota bacterium]|jgi:hypothetical protein